MDFNELAVEINRSLDGPDFNFSSVEVNTTLKFAQEAVSEYLNQFHEESFMGISTKRLLEEVKNLDLNQCIRFSPDGNVIVDVKDRIPDEPTSLAKWLVGFSCGIAMAGSVAVKTFVPALWPASEAINGADIDIFIQVVFENVSVEDINWSKVGIAAMSAAVMAWACPLGASKITENLARQTGSQLLAKLGGYGFKTFSNSIILGSTNAAFTAIDNGSQEEIWDSFRVGAAVGACCTIAASALEETGQAGMKALEYSHPDNWLVKLKDGAMMFINNHQYHLKNAALESILAPKSVYEAAQAGMYQYNKQVTLISGKRGGSYNEVKANSIGEYTQVHETPSYSSTNPTGSRSEMNGPSIKMTTEDHRLTASYGSSRDAIQYRAEQKRLIEQGNYHDAIQMDIEDIQSKFGTKYDAAIDEMLEYAKSIGWW